MASTLAVYPQAELTREAKELLLREWDLILCDVGPEHFDRALTEHIRQNRFFPTIAELRERAGLKKADQDAAQAIAAWDNVIAYADRWIVSDPYGNYGPRVYYGQKKDVPDGRQSKLPIVLPHCGMLPKISLKNVTEPNRIWFHLIT